MSNNSITVTISNQPLMDKLKESIEILLEQITAQAVRAEQLQRELHARDLYIEELNNRHLFPEKLLITNEEAPLTEEQVKKHFVSIDEQSIGIVENPGDANKRFSKSCTK